MKYKAVIWDLDGTLLDTLQDLAGATNYALGVHGMPERTLDEIRQFVGNGVGKLIRRAVPEGTDDECFDRVFTTFKEYYVEHCQEKTKLYDGVKDTLLYLRQNGIKQAIVSNKLQSGVTELWNIWFRDVIDVAIGETPDVMRKPAPDMVLEAMTQLGVEKDEALYVGDSEVDIMTARNTGVECVSVEWGFRTREFLMENGAKVIVTKPSEIIDYLR